RVPTAADEDAARAALGQVGIADLAHKPFHSLSGGQRQRVLTARALAGEPELLVLDEPTVGMDLIAERAMLDLIAGFAAQKIAVVMVTHLLEAVANYVQHLLLVDRDRGLVEAGPIGELMTPERLTRLYNAPVVVAETHGHKSVFVQRMQGRTGGTGGPSAS